MKLCVIYLTYDPSKYVHSFEYIVGNLNVVDADVEYIVVDNFNCKTQTETFGNVHLIAGDNKNFEFSGWQKGLDYANENIKYDYILFCNDSLRSYEHKVLEHQNLNKLIYKSCAENLFFGKRDAVVGKDFNFMGYQTGSWVCTNVFAGPAEIFKFANIDNSDLFDIDVIASDVDVFLNNHSIGKDLRNHIYVWLSYYWHRKFDVRSNLQLFKNKTKCILNEMLLTAKIKECGYNILSSFNEKVYDK